MATAPRPDRFKRALTRLPAWPKTFTPRLTRPRPFRDEQLHHDGANDNNSWNCGTEGGTDDPEIERLRPRQIKNFAAILLLSQGVLMILGGDECRRTQLGTTRLLPGQPYQLVRLAARRQECQHATLFKHMIAFRKRHALLRRRTFFNGRINARTRGCYLAWNSPAHPRMERPSRSRAGVHLRCHWTSISFSYVSSESGFEIPSVRQWFKAIDTAASSPTDILEPGNETFVDSDTYHTQGHSVVVLVSKAA